MTDYQRYFNLNQRAVALLNQGEEAALPFFKEIERIAAENQMKVLAAFQKNRVSDVHFMSSTGYGYDDPGRETLDQVYADVFGAEDALVRHQIISGTHALSLCLFGILRPGDVLLAATGKPYDTLEETIGIRGEGKGSLKDFGVDYQQVDLKDGEPDLSAILSAITPKTKAVLIQRSKGYDFRSSISMEEMGKLIEKMKAVKNDLIVIVDNCYGEFVEEIEPVQVGADLMAGSLIKNPGGSLSPTGGYLAGRKDLVELCSYKLNAVGIGKEAGATLGMNRSMFQGLYFAPFVVSQAVKTALLASCIFSQAGFMVSPAPHEKRSCIIEAIQFNQKEAVLAFCRGIQKGAPVDSFVVPEPWDMPGYESPVIMAAGAFHQGSSIELSADAPIKPPYHAYFQGGVTYDYGKVGILFALNELVEANIL